MLCLGMYINCVQKHELGCILLLAMDELTDGPNIIDCQQSRISIDD